MSFIILQFVYVLRSSFPGGAREAILHNDQNIQKIPMNNNYLMGFWGFGVLGFWG